MSTRIFFVAWLILQIGCASSGGRSGGAVTAHISDDGTVVVLPANTGRVCERVMTTGSKIVQRICYDRAEYEAMKNVDQRALIDEINEESRREIAQSSMREAARSSR